MSYKSIIYSIMVSLTGHVITKIDNKIDTEPERKALSIKIRDEIESKLGRDIPLLDDEQELKKIEDGLILVHKGLSSISNLIGG